MRPLLELETRRTTTERNSLTAEQVVADGALARLKRQQDELRPRLARSTAEALVKPVRVEIAHVDVEVGPELVRRVTVKRQKNERHGVVVELARADETTMALSIQR